MHNKNQADFILFFRVTDSYSLYAYNKIYPCENKKLQGKKSERFINCSFPKSIGILFFSLKPQSLAKIIIVDQKIKKDPIFW